MLLQNIIECVIGLFSCGIITEIKQKVISIVKNSEIEDMFKILENAFVNFKTEYHRTKFFLKNNYFVKPETVNIGYVKEQKSMGIDNTLIMVSVQCHLLSMKQNLKNFFQLPGVYKTVMKHMYDSSNNQEVLTSFLNGSTWTKIKLRFINKTVFPIFLYYDVVEMGNPLGYHSGVHKMGCVYYRIVGFPPEYLSSLDNIFSAYLFHSDDRGTKFSNNQIFSALVKEK